MPRLRRHIELCGLGCCVGQHRRILAWRLGLLPARGPQEAAAEEIETRAPEHWTFHHLEAIDVPLDRAGTPGQGHPGFDCLVILVQPGGEASHSIDSTRGGAFEPGIELRRLPLTDQRGKVPREVHRLRHLGVLRTQRGELLGVCVGALGLAPQHQPGRPAWGQRLAGGRRHRWHGLARAAVPRRKALGLPQTASIGRDYPIAAPIAPLAEVAKQPHRVVAPRIQALEEIRLIGVEPTLAVITTTFAPCKRGALEVALHRAQPQPHVLRNGRGRPPLTVQGPDLRMQGLPAGLALRRALLRWQGDGVGWHGHGEGPIRQGDGLLVHQHIDRVEGLAVHAEHLVQRFPKILHQMKAVGDLGGRGSPVPCALGISGRPSAGNHLDPRMRPEPLRDRLGRPIWEQRHRLPTLQVYQDGAVGLAFPEGEVVHTQHSGCGERRRGLPAQSAEQGVAAHREVPGVAEAHPRFPAQRHTEGEEALGQPQGAARPGGRHRGQALGEDTAAASTIAAKPLADPQLEGHAILRPGQVRQGAPIITMDASRWGGAQRTGGAGLRRVQAQGDLRRGVVDVTHLKAQERGIR
jgi:hypothetical protein